MANKRSFFERLTGAVRLDEDSEIIPDREERGMRPSLIDNVEEDAELTVDVYQTPSEIIITTMVAGVRPDDLDVSITRESVTIRGDRREEHTISDEDYFHRELYWGSFARVINLPEEIDVDAAEASEKHGMLILHLPKLDRNRQTKLRVKG